MCRGQVWIHLYSPGQVGECLFLIAHIRIDQSSESVRCGCGIVYLKGCIDVSQPLAVVPQREESVSALTQRERIARI